MREKSNPLSFVERYRTIIIPAFLILVPVLIGYMLSATLWESFSLPFSNPHNVVGKLASSNQNPLTNSIRWGIAVILPSLVFFTFFINTKFRSYIQSIFTKPAVDSDQNILSNKLTKITLVLFLILPVILFSQKDFTVEFFDDYHEGGEITPAYNYLSHKGVWSGTLFVRGAYQDLFTAYTSWKTFNTVSIGAYRIGVDINNVLTKIALGIFIYVFWKTFENKLYGALVAQLMIFLYFYSLQIQNIDRRTLPFLLVLSVLVVALRSTKSIYFFVAGLFSALCTLYSLDTGIYFTVLLFGLLPLLFITKLYSPKTILNKFLFMILGIIVGWTLFYIFVRKQEFNAFIDNLFYILKVKDLLDSKVYPTISIFKSFRFTLPVIISGFNLLSFCLFSFTFYRKNNLKIVQTVHGILTMASMLIYRSALGRSDLTHVEYSSTLLIILFGVNIALFIYILVRDQKFLRYLVYFLAVLNILFISASIIRTFNLNNIITLDKRVNAYVKRGDEEFLNEKKANGVKELQQIFKNEKCVFSFGNDPLSPYLIKKPSCDRFIISYFAAADPYRDELLSDLQKTNPEYLIFSINSWTQNLDNISNNERYPEVMQYIENNYTPYKTVSDYWNVYKEN